MAKEAGQDSPRLPAYRPNSRREGPQPPRRRPLGTSNYACTQAFSRSTRPPPKPSVPPWAGSYGGGAPCGGRSANPGSSGATAVRNAGRPGADRPRGPAGCGRGCADAARGEVPGRTVPGRRARRAPPPAPWPSRAHAAGRNHGSREAHRSWEARGSREAHGSWEAQGSREAQGSWEARGSRRVTDRREPYDRPGRPVRRRSGQPSVRRRSHPVLVRAYSTSPCSEPSIGSGQSSKKVRTYSRPAFSITRREPRLTAMV